MTVTGRVTSQYARNNFVLYCTQSERQKDIKTDILIHYVYTSELQITIILVSDLGGGLAQNTVTAGCSDRHEH